MVVAYLSMVFDYFRLFAGFLKAGGGRVISFFSSGWSSWLGMGMFVIADHWSTLTKGDLVQTFIDIGVKMGRADSVIAENLPILYGASSSVSYLDALFGSVAALFTVLWFLRTVNTVIKWAEGDAVSPSFRWGVAVSIWLMSVIAVTGSPPTATLELMLNFFDFLDPGNLTGGGVNETVSGNVSG